MRSRGLELTLIDLHLHILPAVDDGPETGDESLEMLKLAASLGFTHLTATPHLHNRLGIAEKTHIDETFLTVRESAEALGLTLTSGFEVRIDPALPFWLEHGDPITLAGTKTVLVELPFSGWPTYTDQVLFDVMAAGFRPLLAHPERYSAGMQNPDLLLALHDRGVLFQLTAGSIRGLFGKGARVLSELLLREGAVDILASDAHSAGRRFVSVSEGISRATELVGAARVHELTYVNPAALLADIPTVPGSPIRRREYGRFQDVPLPCSTISSWPVTSIAASDTILDRSNTIIPR